MVALFRVFDQLEFNVFVTIFITVFLFGFMLFLFLLLFFYLDIRWKYSDLIHVDKDL